MAHASTAESQGTLPSNAPTRWGGQTHKSTTWEDKPNTARPASTIFQQKKPARPPTFLLVCSLLTTYPRQFYSTLGQPIRFFHGDLPPETNSPSLFWMNQW